MVKLQVNNVVKVIEKKTIIDNISFTVNSNDFVIITGKSGTGKTTLLNVISGLTTSDSGEIYLDDALIGKHMQNIWRNKIGFIFQDNLLLENQTVKKNILMGAKFNKKLSDEEINNLLASVDLKGVSLKQQVSALSGGEQQRIALLRTMVKRNEIIFADEPTGNLDEANAISLVKLLKNWSMKDQNAVVMVTHNPEFIQFGTKHINLV